MKNINRMLGDDSSFLVRRSLSHYLLNIFIDLVTLFTEFTKLLYFHKDYSRSSAVMSLVNAHLNISFY